MAHKIMYNDFRMKYNLKALKSGTDFRGDAYGERITLDDGRVEAICRAFIKLLSLKTGKNRFKIALGNDSRLSAERIKRAAVKAICSSGSDVVYTGLSSTPSMFMILQSHNDFDASIMITASHMPKEKNGLKFFTREGGVDGRDIDAICEIAESGNFLSGAGEYGEKSFMDEYAARLVAEVESRTGRKLPLSGKKIIVDAGNGAGGFFAEKVLVPLGANVEGSLYLEPDGNFPNHIPNPEDKGAIDSFAEAVKREKADFGVIFDTDVDRAGCVDGDGREINKSTLIALISSQLLKEKPGVIVTDSVTSVHLTEFIEARGGKHLRYKRGYKNVIDKCRSLNEKHIYSPLAIETSGHAAFCDNFYLDDGAYLIARILPQVAALDEGERLCGAISDFKLPAEEGEVRISFSEKSVDFKAEGDALLKELRAAALKSDDIRVGDDDYEGVRLYFDGEGDGITLIRQSVHDPVLPINFESDEKGGVRYMAKRLYELLKDRDFLNLENLRKFIYKD